MSKKFILNGSHGNKKQTKETKKGDKFDDTSQNLQKKSKNKGVDNLNMSKYNTVPFVLFNLFYDFVGSFGFIHQWHQLNPINGKIFVPISFEVRC